MKRKATVPLTPPSNKKGLGKGTSPTTSWRRRLYPAKRFASTYDPGYFSI